jgi:hypothetical protein
MKHLLIVLLLAGCATVQPELPDGAEATSPAVGSVSFWRWVGKAIMALISTAEIKVEIKADSPKGN